MWWRPPCILQNVIVNLVHEDHAIRCVLWRTRGPWLVLRGATLLPADGTPNRPFDGDIVIHRAQVSYIQVLPPH